MNSKIKNYVEVLFSDVPRTSKSIKLKEELLSTMSKSFEDYIKEGKTESQAYRLVISNLEDIDEILADLMPSDEFIKEAHYFRRRNARNIAIGVAMYILGAAFLIGLGGFGSFLGNQDFYGLLGLIALLIISAIATGIIVYTNMSTPLEYKDYNDVSKNDFSNLDSKHARLLNNIMAIYWTLITFIYLAISFITRRWDITWIIWILASVFQLILKTYFEIKYGNE